MEFLQQSVVLIIAFLTTGKNSQSNITINPLFQIFISENFDERPVATSFLPNFLKNTFSKSLEDESNVTFISKLSALERNVSKPCQELWNCSLATERDEKMNQAEHLGSYYWKACKTLENLHILHTDAIKFVKKMVSTCSSSVNGISSDFRKVINLKAEIQTDKITLDLILDLNGTLTLLEKVLNIINAHISNTRCQFTILVLTPHELLPSSSSSFLDFDKNSKEKELKSIYEKIKGETLVYFILLETDTEVPVYQNEEHRPIKDRLTRNVFIKVFGLHQLSLKRFSISTCSNFVDNLDEVLGKISRKLRRYNLQGEVVRPILYTNGSPGLNAVVKRSLTLVSAMSLILNFTIKPVYGDDWISIGANGSLLGVARLLEASAGDLLSQTHELTIERAEKLDFVFSTVTHREEAFFRQPPRVFDSVMLRPFSAELLLAMGIVSLALFVMMSMVLNFQLKHYNATEQHAHSRYSPFQCINLKAVGESLMGIVGLFTQQGWHELPGIGSLRILSVSGLCLSLVSNMLYSASILSIIKSREESIRSFKDLLESGIHIFIDSDAQNAVGIVKEILRTSNKTVIEKRILRVEDGILKILHNTSAFLSYQFYMENAAEYMGKNTFEKYCTLVSSVLPNPRGLQVYNGMFVGKHSPLRKVFRYSLIRIKQVGLMSSLMLSETKLHGPDRCSKEISLLEPLPFSVISPCFSLLFGFALVGVFLFVLEYIFYKVQHNIITRRD